MVKRIVVLISGSGTNLQALIDAQNTPALPNAQIIHVISNRKAAYGLTRAAHANPPISTSYLALQPFLKANPGSTRDDYDAQIGKMVLKHKPDMVVLAGWMHILGQRFLELLDGSAQAVDDDGTILNASTPVPVINLHPALPGAFDGASAIERAYEAFKEGKLDKTGVMVHRVIKEVDRGAPVVVREIPFVEGESLEEFEERLHKIEWEVIVQGTAKIVEEIEE